MELKERIILARKQAGLSQEQLGEKLGVSRQAVSKWESGQTNPDVAYVAEMCRLFGVSADWLLLGEEGAKEAAPARCPSCQTIITGMDRFCPNCGRNLSGKQSDTYTLLLKPGENTLTFLNSDITGLSRTGWFSEQSPLHKPISSEEAGELVRSAPVILERGLSQEMVRKMLDYVTYQNRYGVYRDSDGDDAEQLVNSEPVQRSQLDPPKEPLSFGMIVLAVVIGILIMSFL